MDAKMRLLLGVALVSGWYSCCTSVIQSASMCTVHTPCDDGTPLLADCQTHDQGYGVDCKSGDCNDGLQYPEYYDGPHKVTDSGEIDDSHVQRYFQEQKTLETDNLILMPIVIEHVEALTYFLGSKATEHLVSNFITSRMEGRAAPWAIYLKNEKKIIGYGGFDTVHDEKGVIVFELLNDYCQKKGIIFDRKNEYFEEAMRVILYEGFEVLQLQEVCFSKRDCVPGLNRVTAMGFESPSLSIERVGGRYELIRHFVMDLWTYYTPKKQDEAAFQRAEEALQGDDTPENQKNDRWLVRRFKALWSGRGNRNDGQIDGEPS